MKIFPIAVFCCGWIVPAGAQIVSVGVKGGVPITDALETFRGNSAGYFTHTRRYTVGPTFELHLPARFSIEVDALYKRLGFDYSSTTPPVLSSTTRANSWEFPILGKFELLPGPIRPFLDAGVSIRNISGIHQVREVVSGVTLNRVEISNPPEFNKATDVGFAFGAGIAFKIGPVRISPEFRYTRWGGENLRDPIGALLRTNRDQGDFLLGLTF
ncbi:MAG: PorT family protein [Bryobacterales bacterium]|nr:PorT family protein [Bryobacterales bacterium]